MNYPLLKNKEDVMLTINELNSYRHNISSLVSSLSELFINTIVYSNLTKQDALDAIGYILYEHHDLIHSQLFDCFLKHCLFKSINESKFITVNYDQLPTISGIFLPLTPCYSPSCLPHFIDCYSPLCPNKRISSILTVINNELNQNESDITCSASDYEKDWIESIPQHIRDMTDKKELKRQAAIAELILKEKNYCQNLETLHTVYALPLLQSTGIITNPLRQQIFHDNVFGNYQDISRLHQTFYNELKTHNRQSSFFVGRVGTILMQHATCLVEPYIQYTSNYTKAIHCMTIEHKNNEQFAQFLETQNGLKSTRRLGLRHYLTAPTLWIGKFRLMVEAILKNTTDDADQLSLKASLTILQDTLQRMNASTSTRHSLRLEELSTSIYVTDGELLKLPDKTRLIREEAIWLARSTHPLQPILCHLFLFSHALLLTSPRLYQNRLDYSIIQTLPIAFLTFETGQSPIGRRLSFASTSIVSTPIYLLNQLRRQKSINRSPLEGPKVGSRTLVVGHAGYPDHAFQLEFLTRHDRRVWKGLLKDLVGDQMGLRLTFKIALVCSSLQGEEEIGKVQCSVKFAYSGEFNDQCSESLIGFGTSCGMWLGSLERKRPFYLVLPNQDIQQVSVMNDMLVALVIENKQTMLVAYGLKSIIKGFYTRQPFHLSGGQLDWCMIKRSSIICFKLGKIRNQPVVAYLVRKAQHIWLSIVIPQTPVEAETHWFKKYKTEHKISIKEPTDIQIVCDSIFIQSDRYGIERIDIFNQEVSKINWVFMGPHIGLITSSVAIVSDRQQVYSISLFEDTKPVLKFKFESQVNHVAFVHPYLIGFSSSVIEIRHLETTELIQVLRGHRIRFISTTNDVTQPILFIMANSTHPNFLSVYQLQLIL